MTLTHVLALALLSSASPPRESKAVRVEEVSRSAHPREWGAGPALHVDLAYFDAEDHLRWDGDLVVAAGTCTPGSFDRDVPATARCERRTVLRTPRVDECRCLAAEPAGTRAAVVYVGVDDARRERWRRPPPASGIRPRTLAGAHATGLVFDDGEVWSPASGGTLRPGTRGLGLHRGCWLPERDAFLEVDADVTLVRTRGGLYLRSRDGARTLVLPAERRLVGHWVIRGSLARPRDVPGPARGAVRAPRAGRGPVHRPRRGGAEGRVPPGARPAPPHRPGPRRRGEERARGVLVPGRERRRVGAAPLPREAVNPMRSRRAPSRR